MSVGRLIEASKRDRFPKAEVELAMAEAKREESEPESQDHPEDIVALEDPNDGLGISPRVRLVVATLFSQPNNKCS